MSNTIVMYDSVTIDTVPDNPEAVAGYVGGHWPTYIPLVQRFPHALHLSIAVNSGEDAMTLDVEAGDATPADAPAWVARQLSRGVHRPVVYSSVSGIATILDDLRAHGIARDQVRVWSAHYTHPHICDPSCGFGMPTIADGTQWTLAALGRNLDQSMLNNSFFAPPPPFVDTAHYGRFSTGPFPYGKHGAKTLDERATVQEFDHLSVHPGLHVKTLGKLRDEMTFLRKRVWFEAVKENPLPDGKPSWGDYNRGWRWKQLKLRTEK